MNNQCQANHHLDAGALNKLKLKTIEEFNSFLNDLYRGYRKDYSRILTTINFIEVLSELDNNQILYQYFLNNGM